MYKIFASVLASLALGICIGWSITTGSGSAGEFEASAECFERVERSILRLESSLADRAAPGGDGESIEVAVCDETRIEQAVERVVKNELRGAVARRPTQSESEPAEIDSTPAREREEAYELAHETVLSAAANRRWTDADGDVLRKALGSLTPAQRQEVVEGLARTINEAQLEIEGGFPF